MVTNLMRNHIRLGKIARGVKSPFQLPKKLGIEIDLSVFRAIEGARCGLSESTRRLSSVGKENELRVLILTTQVTKLIAPHIFCISEHHRDKFLLTIIDSRAAWFAAG